MLEGPETGRASAPRCSTKRWLVRVFAADHRQPVVHAVRASREARPRRSGWQRRSRFCSICCWIVAACARSRLAISRSRCSRAACAGFPRSPRSRTSSLLAAASSRARGQAHDALQALHARGVAQQPLESARSPASRPLRLQAIERAPVGRQRALSACERWQRSRLELRQRARHFARARARARRADAVRRDKRSPRDGERRSCRRTPASSKAIAAKHSARLRERAQADGARLRHQTDM